MSDDWSLERTAIGVGEMYKGRFEYRTEERPCSAAVEADGALMSGRELAAWLNTVGARGWQLCAEIRGVYGAAEFIFKRELP